MKKLLSLISLLLVLSMLLSALVGCKKDPADTDNDDVDDTLTPSEEEDTGPYVLTENYMPEDVFKKLKSSFEGQEISAFVSFDPALVPVVSLDVATITNCTVKSVKIPVIQTLTPDADGNFTYTINTVNSSLKGLRSPFVSTHKIKRAAFPHL